MKLPDKADHLTLVSLASLIWCDAKVDAMVPANSGDLGDVSNLSCFSHPMVHQDAFKRNDESPKDKDPEAFATRPSICALVHEGARGILLSVRFHLFDLQNLTSTSDLC